MMNKRGISPLEWIVGALIVIVVAILVISWARSGVFGGKSFFDAQMGELGDLDHDDLRNKDDLCRCQEGPFLNEGCPESVDISNVSINDRFKDCPQEYCDQFDIKGCPSSPYRST